MGQTLKDHNSFPKLGEVPTPKRIASYLGLDIKDMIANLETNGSFKDLSRKFLESQAIELEKNENWKAFSVILALFIHGIVIFPNIDKFVDNLAIELFLANNHMPFLLTGTYYSLHICHEKKCGTLLCCASLSTFGLRLI